MAPNVLLDPVRLQRLESLYSTTADVDEPGACCENDARYDCAVQYCDPDVSGMVMRRDGREALPIHFLHTVCRRYSLI